MKRGKISIIHIVFVSLVMVQWVSAQDVSKEEKSLPLKIKHAEPLYIDLIRDLGARKGEKEWNVGMGMTDKLHYDSYEFLVEYEWAVMDRWGMEVEVPVSINRTPAGQRNGSEVVSSNHIESIKLATQYTFLVSDAWRTSMAIGGITEFTLYDMNSLGREGYFDGILYNPFLIVAKRLGADWHSLVYTGPRIHTFFDSEKASTFEYELNTSVHWMLPNSDHFIGIETNQIFAQNDWDMVIRPQMRLTLSDSLKLGIVPGIPVSKEKERLSAFVRLIYEPRHRH